MKTSSTLLVVSFLVFSYITNAQNTSNNLVPNSSFENGSSPPTMASDFSQLNNWVEIQTPDWMYEGAFMGKVKDYGLSLLAHSGKGFAGFGACESGGVQLTSTIPAYTMVKVSFWWSYLYALDNQIEYFLTQNEVNPDALNDCTNEDFPQDFVGTFNISNLPPDMRSDYGSVLNRQWYYYESDWVMTTEDYNWFYFKGMKNTVGSYDQYITGNDYNYLFIDDISVITEPLCSSACYKLGDSITVVGNNTSGIIPNACLPNYDPWSIQLNNANDYELWIFDRWGAIDQHKREHCNSGFNNYIVFWNGENADNILAYNSGVYVWQLHAWNCFGSTWDVSMAGNVTLFMGYTANIGDASLVSFSQDCTFDPNCAAETCAGPTNYNETPINPPFLIQSNDDIDFSNMTFNVDNGLLYNITAANEIVIDPNTDISLGANFWARIEDCSEEDRKQINNKPFLPSISIPEVKDDINLYPNPTSNFLIITATINFNTIQIFNSIELLKTYNFGEESMYQIDVSNLPNGIYFIRILFKDGSIRVRKLEIIR